MTFLKTKIGRRLLATFLVVSLLPLVFVGWIVITRGDIALKEEARFGLSAASSAAGGKLREFLLSLKQGTLALSLDTRIAQALEQRANGQARPAKDDQYLPEILGWYHRRIFDAEEIFVASADGTVIASSDPRNLGRDVSLEEYFIHGKHSYYPGDVAREQEGKVTWVMTAPITNTKRELMGVAACRVDPHILSALTSGRRSVAQGASRQLFRIGKTGETYIVNEDGFMVTESRVIPNAVLNVRVATLPVRMGLKKKEEITGDYKDYRGVNVSGTSILFPDMGWVLITEMDFTESFAPIRQLRNGLLVIVCLLAILITTWAWRWTEKLVTPLQKLRESDTAMAEGNENFAIVSEEALPDNEIGDFVRLRNQRVKTLFEKQHQLAVEQKRREEALAELQEMSYSIVHDMRAPLRAICNFAAIVEAEAAGRLEEEHRDMLQRMNKAALRMDRLIADMLSYSRMAREELPLHTVNVSQLLSGIIDTYPSLQTVRSHIHIAEDLPLVHGNESALMQCFACLLDNAVKFKKPNQPPEIHITAERNEDKVKFFVVDNGIGIPKHMEQTIFGIFQQGAPSPTNTGIGLALVRKAADRMGGKVGLSSQPGKGSCFWIELPSAKSIPQTLQSSQGRAINS